VDDDEACDRIASCVTHDIWKKLKRSMVEVLSSITLQDMVVMHEDKSADSVPMYFI
jgi:DNA-binding IscR family transcriptional regulator